MGLRASLLATVSSITNWAIRYENMGLFNAIYKPAGNSEFELNANRDDIFSYLINVTLARPLSLPVLEALPREIGGGAEGVRASNSNPNREPVFLWATVAIFFLLLLCIIILLIVNCCCCCCGRKDSKRALRRLQMAAVDAEIPNKSIVCRVTYLALMTIALLFLVASVTLIAVYFSSANMVIAFIASNNDQTSSNTLSGSLKSAINHMLTFLEKGIDSGEESTNMVLNSFTKKTQNEIAGGIDGTITSILLHLKLKSTLNSGVSVQETITSSETSAGQVAGQVDNLKGGFTDMKTKIEKLTNDYQNQLNCNSGDTVCEDLKKKITALKTPVDPGNLDSVSIKAYEAVLGRTETNLKDQLQKVNESIAKIDEQKVEIIEKLKEKLDLNSVLSSVGEFWGDLKSETDSISNSLSSQIDSISSSLSTAGMPIRIALYAVGGLLAFMLLIAVILTIVLLCRSFRDQLYEDPDELSLDHGIRRLDKCACGKCSACCCSLLFVILLLIFTIIIGLTLFLLTMISGEGCTYLIKDSAVVKTDYVFNSILAQTEDSTIPNDLFNFHSPENLLSAILTKCNYNPAEKPVGLLTAMGYSNLINIEGLVNSDTIQQALNESKTNVVDQIKGLNIAAGLPSTAELEQLMNDLKTSFGMLNLAPLITETDGYAMKVEKMGDLCSEIIQHENNTLANLNADFLNIIRDLNGQKDQVEETHTQLNGLNDISKLENPFNEFLKNFKATLDACQESSLVPKVEGDYDTFREELTDFIKSHGEVEFTKLTQQLLPCLEMHEAYTSGVGAVCDETGGVHLLIGYFYILALNVLFMVFLYFALFNFSFFQFIIIRMGTGDEEDEFNERSSSFSSWDKDDDDKYDDEDGEDDDDDDETDDEKLASSLYSE